MSDIGQEFIARSRHHFTDDYLPKIERCLERLTDEQIWWRANEHSNSVANLLLHLEGNARQWIISGVGGATDRRERDREFDERGRLPGERLMSSLRATLEEADSVLARLDATA